MLVVAHHTPTASKAMSQYDAMIDLRTRAVSNGRGDGMRRTGRLPFFSLVLCPQCTTGSLHCLKRL
jgi:hypothetical protein